MNDSLQLEHRVASDELEKVVDTADLEVVDYQHPAAADPRVEVEVFKVRERISVRAIEQYGVKYRSKTILWQSALGRPFHELKFGATG